MESSKRTLALVASCKASSQKCFLNVTGWTQHLAALSILQKRKEKKQYFKSSVK